MWLAETVGVENAWSWDSISLRLDRRSNGVELPSLIGDGDPDAPSVALPSAVPLPSALLASPVLASPVLTSATVASKCIDFALLPDLAGEVGSESMESAPEVATGLAAEEMAP